MRISVRSSDVCSSDLERPGRDHRHQLRRVPVADGAHPPASGAESRGADESDGRRLARRRLVPQRRLPPAEPALHPRTGCLARQQRQMVVELSRRLRRSEEHTSELQSLMRISYAVFCLKKKTTTTTIE